MRRYYDASRGKARLKKLKEDTLKGKCVICKKDLPNKKRRFYCSDECAIGANNLFWDTASWTYISQNLKKKIPNCEICGEKFSQTRDDRYSNAEVHHIIPIKDGGAEFDEKNCIVLCSKCHKTQHRKGDWVDEIISQ